MKLGTTCAGSIRGLGAREILMGECLLCSLHCMRLRWVDWDQDLLLASTGKVWRVSAWRLDGNSGGAAHFASASFNLRILVS